MRTVSIKYLLSGLLLSGLAFSSCTEADLSDDFPPGDPPPVPGGYKNSSEVAPTNLVAHFTFDGSVNDAKGAITGGTANGTTSWVTGVKGQAYKGSTNGFISYTNPGPVATLKSFTVTMWINTDKHDGGAQGIYTLTKQDGSFWGNFFMLIESNTSTENKMFMKLHFEKNGVTNAENWVEPNGDFRPDNMYGGWRHVAWTYDATTSKVGWYVNGEKRTLPPGVEDRKADAAGTPLGELNFKDPTRFVIGGYQNQLGSPYNNPEPWMLTYTGALDEFRIYNKALSAQEISALAVLEKQGR
ncbi:LamG domain-containing protein [Flavisolibacter tropicus]|uniref:LamG-like jellyroll fold domain-containing protein n=1 Tax=Flavisolibacter tropicus TaxID=1492898 RepID=A0A172TQZ6_9BACT|nr:LamG domain-containing protein [Flavisolibacter tropicus]ANE49450.1 hypothetical protein SY85_01980 [Flavisolibacter tropicus]